MSRKDEDTKATEATVAEERTQTGRRGFLGAAGLVIGAGVVSTLPGCGPKPADSTPTPPATPTPTPEPAGGGAHASNEVPPGQLDTYYGLWSGGQSGEIRIVGVPSMRELKRIPVFNRDSATGWGRDDFSKQLLGNRESGDTHHVHPSYHGGTYDGRFIFVNDKAGGRVARVRCDTMECDHIVTVPFGHGTHGIFPQRHHTGLVFCNSEFQAPLPIPGTNPQDPHTYSALHTAIDGETMELKWQVLVDGNMDLCATDYEGKYSFATCYNSERGAHLADMMAAEKDFLYVFNLARITAAVAAGTDVIRLGDSPVPVVDARSANSPYVLRIPVPKSPHGVNVSPDGKYAIALGKLSPTASIVEIAKLDAAFAGTIQPIACIVAEPELGLGPLHTAFDGRGNAYTSIFIDSVICKWNIAKAIAAHTDDTIDPIVQKIDVHYQVGHTNASMSETKDADGKWLIALCKFSKDRFLNVGPLHPENDQLIDISGERMVLMHDGPTYPEPHDCVMVERSIINPIKMMTRNGPRFDMYEAWAREDGITLLTDTRVIRKSDTSVRVYMTSRAPSFALTEFNVKQGDSVQIIVTNQDNVEDLTHGFCMTHHDVNFVVNPQDTRSMTFVADRPGMFWYYCPWFCHALHLEMRGRMFVEARA